MVQRECIEGPDIHGSYHHYGHLDWWAPEDQYDGEYARPTCPVSQLGCVDEPAECTRVAERITDDEGRGAWYCGWHGTFRVFDYPRERQRNSPGEQQTLIADGGRERPEGEVEQCPYCLGEGTVKRRYGTVGPGPAKIVKTRECPVCCGDGTVLESEVAFDGE